jgi:hypothetical protein
MKIAIDKKIFEQVAKMVRANETAEDLWNIFDYTMTEFDHSYEKYDADHVGYLFLIYVFGYVQGNYEVQDYVKISH